MIVFGQVSPKKVQGANGTRIPQLKQGNMSVAKFAKKFEELPSIPPTMIMPQMRSRILMQVCPAG